MKMEMEIEEGKNITTITKQNQNLYPGST